MAAGFEGLTGLGERLRDPTLSVLLGVQILLIFVAYPLAVMGTDLPLVATAPLAVLLILVLASRRAATFAVALLAVGVRVLAAIIASHEITPATETVNTITGIGELLVLAWIVAEVVFGPGRITAHRVRGCIVLYLAIAMIFAWLYRLIADLMPGAFSAALIRSGDAFTIGSFSYYSLTTLTTLGLGDIVPVNALARSLTSLEAIVGQVYPAIVLARMLTLYSDARDASG